MRQKKRTKISKFKALKQIKPDKLPDVVGSSGSTASNKTGSWRTLKPLIDDKICISCMICWKFCPDVAVIIKGNKPKINYDYCKGCGICLEECPVKAILWEEEEK